MKSRLECRDKKIGHDFYRVLLHKIIDLMKETYAADLVSVALFGSVARGEASELSDIDLLVILKGTASDPMQKFLYILKELRKDPEYLRLRGEGFLPDPFPIFLTEKELDARSLILLDILDHGIILYDAENCLKRKLEALERRLRELGSKKIYLSDGSWFWDLKPDWKPGEIIEL